MPVRIKGRGESKPERPGTSFRLKFLVGWYYGADTTKQLLHLIS